MFYLTITFWIFVVFINILLIRFYFKEDIKEKPDSFIYTVSPKELENNKFENNWRI